LEAYQQRLSAFEALWPAVVATPHLPSAATSEEADTHPHWSREGRWLTASTEHIEVRFNCRRGLAVEHFIDRRINATPLFGTLHHGRFDGIALVPTTTAGTPYSNPPPAIRSPT
jgi:hypothetical protein